MAQSSASPAKPKPDSRVSPAESTGGEQLSGKQVPALALNKRDFNRLLLLAAGTQVDTNGAAAPSRQIQLSLKILY
jgi:hypothetical protein